MASRLNQMLLNRYRIEAHLGKGGMAEVYKAWDARRNHYVAIKVLKESLAQDLEIVRSFTSEARVLAHLSHANIVRFYSFEHKGPLAFIVMDYIEGITLRQHILAAKGYPFTLQEVSSILAQICAALHYAHAEGVIHRDVKPSNIILRTDGQALLSDFGIAQAFGAGSALYFESGTPAYMSPEQFQGRVLDARTDIYSLSVVIYEMLAGHKPFLGDTQGAGGTTRDRVRWEHLYAEPPPLSQFNISLPEGIITLVTQSLSKDRDTRPPTAMDLLQRWQAVTTSQLSAQEGRRDRMAHLPLPSILAGDLGKQQEATGLPPSRRGQLQLDRRIIALGATALAVLVMVALLAAVLGTGGSAAPQANKGEKVSTTVSDSTSAKLKPGVTRVERCFNQDVAKGIRLIFCVEQVTVLLDGSLKFDVSWTGEYEDKTYKIKKGSDAQNENMNITDNLGSRHDHMETGGAAANDVVLVDRRPAYGWFLFPKPASEATTFTFHDDDNGQSISDIQLAGW